MNGKGTKEIETEGGDQERDDQGEYNCDKGDFPFERMQSHGCFPPVSQYVFALWASVNHNTMGFFILEKKIQVYGKKYSFLNVFLRNMKKIDILHMKVHVVLQKKDLL